MGDLKLIVGHPGMPDGHIRPDEVSRDENINGNENNQVEQEEKDKKHLDVETITSNRIYLFNITGIPY